MREALWQILFGILTLALGIAIPLLPKERLRNVLIVLFAVCGAIFLLLFGYDRGATIETQNALATIAARPSPTIWIITTTPVPTSTPVPTVIPTPLPDELAAISVVYQANEEIKSAFLDVTKDWTKYPFKYWCANVLADLERYKNGKQSLFQSTGRIIASYDRQGELTVRRVGLNLEVTQIELWTFKFDVKSKPTPPLEQSPKSESPRRYVYTLQQSGDKFCISKFTPTTAQ